jgi:hypothetical protein
MLVRFFNRGQGKGTGPIQYLLGKDGKREGATLLRGNPDQSVMLIDSLNFSYRYTSGVLSFEEAPDQVTDEQKQEIMDSFEAMLLPDMDDRINWTWVEHTDKDRLELNFVIANVDLETQKRVQPFYWRSDTYRVDTWKDLQNARYQFTDPNQKPRMIGYVQKDENAPTKIPKAQRERKKLLYEAAESYTNELLEMGVEPSRDDLIDYFKEAMGDEIETITTKPKSISVKFRDSARNVRLEGEIFSEHYTREARRENATGQEPRGQIEEGERESISRSERAPDSAQTSVPEGARRFDGHLKRVHRTVAELEQALTESIEHKRGALAKRYGLPDRADQPDTERQRDQSKQPDTGAVQRAGDVHGSDQETARNIDGVSEQDRTESESIKSGNTGADRDAKFLDDDINPRDRPRFSSTDHSGTRVLRRELKTGNLDDRATKNIERSAHRIITRARESELRKRSASGGFGVRSGHIRAFTDRLNSFRENSSGRVELSEQNARRLKPDSEWIEHQVSGTLRGWPDKIRARASSRRTRLSGINPINGSGVAGISEQTRERVEELRKRAGRLTEIAKQRHASIAGGTGGDQPISVQLRDSDTAAERNHQESAECYQSIAQEAERTRKYNSTTHTVKRFNGALGNYVERLRVEQEKQAENARKAAEARAKERADQEARAKAQEKAAERQRLLDEETARVDAEKAAERARESQKNQPKPKSSYPGF